ncbi:hypothetical protein DRP53_08405 [candidate division WOR-3 bacterium]|uniref:Glycosyltransferase RgtA/B/C/D-like domain-containing protein n=1 Tax=candidate division WOR-3 bacterium TaxID=2052148 RepID=A0A660SHA5_UNCW3|nr:MAG: hypothetical protein DRP53_08405 [candidate division WOR-3 bacterium]
MLSPGEPFFRPIQVGYFILNRYLFGLHPLGWNIVSLAIHTLNLFLIIELIKLLYPKGKGLPFLSGLIFAAHFIHTEPIFWTSAATTLLVATFLILSLISYLKNSHILSLIFFVLALLSKEDGVIIPFVLLVIIIHQGSPFRAALPYFTLLGLYLLIRLICKSPFHPVHYQIQIHPLIFIKNLTFLFSGLTVWVDYRLLRTIWYGASSVGHMLSLISSHLEIVFSLILSWLLFLITLIFGTRKERILILLIIFSFLPFLFLVGSGERFLYIPSIWFSLLIGMLLLRIPPFGRMITAGCLLLYFAIFSIGNSYRWIMAGRTSGEIIGFLARIEKKMEEGERIIFINPPEDIDGAWVFRNGLEFIDELYFAKKVEVIPVKSRPIPPLKKGDRIIIWERRNDGNKSNQNRCPGRG